MQSAPWLNKLQMNRLILKNNLLKCTSSSAIYTYAKLLTDEPVDFEKQPIEVRQLECDLHLT